MLTAGGESDDDDAAMMARLRIIDVAAEILRPPLGATEQEAVERGARQALKGVALRGRAAKDTDGADAVEQLAKPRRAAEATATSIFWFSFLALRRFPDRNNENTRREKSARQRKKEKRRARWEERGSFLLSSLKL